MLRWRVPHDCLYCKLHCHCPLCIVSHLNIPLQCFDFQICQSQATLGPTVHIVWRGNVIITNYCLLATSIHHCIPTEIHPKLSKSSVTDSRKLITYFPELKHWGDNDKKCFLLQVGALFSLSCVISTETFPAASQLSSCKWRDFMSKRPKDVPGMSSV